MKIYHIVAVSKNNVIGKDGDLPFKIPGDLKRFKELTMNHAVLMGRKTWESLPKKFRPLKGRRNLIVTRTSREPEDEEVWFSTIQRAIDFAELEDYSELYIIGGGQIYQETFDIVDEIRMTLWNEDVEGNVFYQHGGEQDIIESMKEYRITYEEDMGTHKYIDWVLR